MLMLTATASTQGQRPDDSCGTIEDELVVVFDDCADPGAHSDGLRCSGGCPRRFYGLSSHQMTTTAKVRDVEGFSCDDYQIAIAAYCEQRGSGAPEVAGSFLASGMLDQAAMLLPGTVVGFDDGKMTVRSRPRPTWRNVAVTVAHLLRFPQRHRYYDQQIKALDDEHRQAGTA
jgi:hypothetical protein